MAQCSIVIGMMQPHQGLKDTEKMWLVAEKSGRNKEEMYRNLRAGAESGIDFSSRWFDDKKNFITIEVIDFIPVDLNALMVHLEQMIAKGRKLKNDN